MPGVLAVAGPSLYERTRAVVEGRNLPRPSMSQARAALGLELGFAAKLVDEHADVFVASTTFISLTIHGRRFVELSADAARQVIARERARGGPPPLVLRAAQAPVVLGSIY